MDPHEVYFKSLPREEVQLIALREILYDKSWDELVRDLEARKQGRPHVFKLSSRIDVDLERIQKLRAYETKHRVDLGKFVTSELLAAGRRSV